jgi:hypothetical protein
MIKYQTKNTVSELKINDRPYKIDITQEHTEQGPKISIKVDSDSGDFNICAVNLDIMEAHTVLNEVMNALATITHIHYGGAQAPIGHPQAPIGQPAVASPTSFRP